MKRLLLITAALAATVIAAGIVSWQLMQRYLDTPLSVDAPTAVRIPKGATLGSVLDDLRARDITDDIHWLMLDARLAGDAHRIQAGDYTLRPGTTPRQMLAAFIAGAVDLERLTLIEGWSAASAIEAMVSSPAIRDDLGVVPARRADGTPWLDAQAHEALAKRLGIEHDSIEGWLYPDTYRFARGTTASELLSQAHARMRAELEAAWREADAPATITTPYEALILASIIEKETALASERGLIAGVFTRRLERGMRLQTDPTVIYGIGAAYDGNIRRSDLDRTTDYNTYRIDGLPPTPIALPSRASIDAALAPVDSDALYFVATGKPDGSHYFSATVDEHNAAVARYLRRLRGGR